MSSKTYARPRHYDQCALANPDPAPAPATAPASKPPVTDYRALLDHRPVLAEDKLKVWEYPNSDAGNAAFFLQYFREVLRYIPERSQWMIYHQGRWHADSTGRLPAWMQSLSIQQLRFVEDYRKALAQKLADEVSSQEELPKGKKKLTRAEVERQVAIAKGRAEDLGDEKTIAQALQAASRTGSLIVPAAEWDANPWCVGVQNGVLDLKTFTFRPGAPDDLVTLRMNAEYSAAATCPQWRAFVARVLPDTAVADYFQRVCGYALTGSTDDQAFYFSYGSGKNGKSIFYMALAWLFGSYGAKARNTLVEESRNGGDPKADVAQLPGVRFLYGEETRAGSKLREEFVKSLVAGDPLTGEAKYQAPFTFIPRAKLFLMGNHRPRISGTDLGIWRRVRLIPFLETISDSEAIAPSVLMERFRGEASGILNWLLEGLKECPSGSIPMPDVIANAVREYREGEDDLGDFITECTQDSIAGQKVPKGQLYEAYRSWADDNGINHSLTLKGLSRQLRDRPGWVMDSGKRAWLNKSLIA